MSAHKLNLCRLPREHRLMEASTVQKQPISSRIVYRFQALGLKIVQVCLRKLQFLDAAPKLRHSAMTLRYDLHTLSNFMKLSFKKARSGKPNSLFAFLGPGCLRFQSLDGVMKLNRDLNISIQTLLHRAGEGDLFELFSFIRLECLGQVNVYFEATDASWV